LSRSEKIAEVVLVDANDQAIGVMEKLEAHRKGLLHRAFSVFIFNDKGQLLLQQRANDKYHSGGLWTNTCCSHPLLDEDPRIAAERRLKEEMGFTVPLKFLKSVTYRASFNNGLVEHEFDHIFTGVYNADPQPDPAEVVSWKHIDPIDLAIDMKSNPDVYTAWLKVILPEVMDHFYNT
jgi:isopentenyl-diphosphate Delta-isomerase